VDYNDAHFVIDMIEAYDMGVSGGLNQLSVNPYDYSEESPLHRAYQRGSERGAEILTLIQFAIYNQPHPFSQED